jgi:rhomboid protease GluP
VPTTTTFGKRGVVQAPASPISKFNAAAPASNIRSVAVSAVRAPERTVGEKSLLDSLPIMTVTLILFLFCIYGLERHWAFDIGRGGAISLESLIAFGGASYDRVVGAGEYWRLFLAPLLHGSSAHVVGNCVALFFVGLRLERMIGRAWLAAIFVISALGGEVGSLCGNPHAIVTVGASGAITGLIGALFVVSFDVADPVLQRRMLWTAARFGAPALAPLFYGGSGPVDYYAHAGGAVAGATVGWLLSAIWAQDHHRPLFGREAVIGSLFGLAASLASCGFAAAHYADHSQRAAQFIPSTDIASDFKFNVEQSTDLVTRYPKDPRSHIARAISMMRAKDLSNAESELRIALSLASSEAAMQPTKNAAQALLAVVIASEGRRNEAKAMVADLCRDRAKAAAQPGDVLGKSKLCD